MPMLLIASVIVPVALVHRYLHPYAPSNLLLARWRRRRSRRIHDAAVLIALGFAAIALAHAVHLVVLSGAPRWLYVVVMLLAWDGMKFAGFGVVTAMRVMVSALVGDVRVRGASAGASGRVAH
ncbi:hypothetical protein KVF89_25220 [Nocardioides carbamazepini]|uniref:hypothetical protein n=1 Tax=Nocardioides carbamazepini TaxID=2854259 RepID=UPI0021499B54|nr:hypothetical protein [Nocardioides carbamazepini]MCR1785861.1 hypothetical protein [Nocardioides carbamazepini]